MALASSGCRSELGERGPSVGFPSTEAFESYGAEEGPPAPLQATTLCTVTRIADGDTLDCEPLGRVRLLGIDTPELQQEPFGSQAAAALRSLIPVGTELRAEGDVEDRDQYDRALRYLWLDGVLINWVMVRSGHAVLLTYAPNVRYVESLQRAQALARDQGVGLWATGGFECEPVEFRRGDCH